MPKAVFNIAFTSKYPPTNMAIDKKAEYFNRRSFYNGTAEFNVFKYLLDGKKVAKNKDIFSYATREGNNGAFNLKGEIDDEKMQEIKENMKTTDSHIWHGVISFDEETSKGFNTQENAMKFLRQSFNAFLSRTHLNKDNIELFACLHDDTDNRHIHFTFFEKQPLHRNKDGSLSYTKKGCFSDKAIENYLVSANMHLDENSYDYYSARDRAMEALKQLRANAVESKLNNNELRNRVIELADKLPKSGRLEYNSENLREHRKDIDDVALLLVKSSPEATEADRQLREIIAEKEREAYGMFTSPVNKQMQYVNGKELETDAVQQLLREGKTEYLRANNIDWNNIDFFEKLRQEYNSRLGNQVLGLIKEMNKDFNKKNRTAFNDKQKKIESRIERRHSKKVFNNFMRSLGSYQQGVQTDFTYKLHQVQNQIQQEQSQAE